MNKYFCVKYIFFTFGKDEVFLFFLFIFLVLNRVNGNHRDFVRSFVTENQERIYFFKKLDLE